MKLATINDHSPAVILGDRAVEVSSVVPQILEEPETRRMIWLIEHYEALRPVLSALSDEEGTPLSSVRLRAPIAPGKIPAAVGNYREGLEYTQPIDFFMKSPHTVIGPGDTVHLPNRELNCVDHEAELMAIIGRRVSGPLSAAEAQNAIFGYTCFVDVSARGFGEVGFIRKSCDTFGPMGPWIVTADELGDPHRLDVRLTVAGELRQEFNTSDMDHSVPSQVAWLASIMTLDPGDAITTGTNHQGCGRIQDGDHVELSISGIGTLTFEVSDPLGRSWERGTDQRIAALAKQWRQGSRERS